MKANEKMTTISSVLMGTTQLSDLTHVSGNDYIVANTKFISRLRGILF